MAIAVKWLGVCDVMLIFEGIFFTKGKPKKKFQKFAVLSQFINDIVTTKTKNEMWTLEGAVS